VQHLLPWVTLLAFCGLACDGATTGSSTAPIELTVTNFGQTMFGAPFAVAKDKGYFKEVGIDVTGFITSAGGGTTIRNALASEIPYGEVALAAAIAAIQQGVELKIVHAGVVSVADQVWVTRKDDTSIKTFADLRGKRLAYSSPQSVTDMITTMLLDQAKLAGQVERRSTGTIAAGLTALRAGGVDMTYVNEPVWSQEKGNYRMVWNSTKVAPRVTATVGIVRTDYLTKNPDKIRAIIAARKKGVEYILNNPAESAAALAREYKIELVHAKSAIETILSGNAVYWSGGRFDMEGMNVMLQGLQLVKAIEPGSFNWANVIDERYLPDDERSK
jgi:NitT/TauT family transport system substrate-binding protein